MTIHKEVMSSSSMVSSSTANNAFGLQGDVGCLAIILEPVL
jgi:hypothetical protein